jgi:transcriptional antiterminator RfaH
MEFHQGWYVVYTKSRYEKKIVNLIEEKEVSVYLPLISKINQWSDRKKIVETPLFNSYVFVYLKNYKDYLNVLAVSGVVFFIKIGGKLVRVLDEEINKIKIFLRQFSDIEIKNSLEIKIGEKKTIKSGPFQDYQCEILRIDNKNKICVRIDSLGQSLLAEIHPYHLV